ncbi:MAG TPA: hypothetical protein VHY79_17605 [Rhizomicrobium sp.]|nr:hypothetical protein [Rhizomicrobium sp.]
MRGPPRRDGGRADKDDSTGTGRGHGRDHFLAGRNGSISVDPPCGFEIVERDALNVAPDARACIVDERRGIAHFGADGGESAGDGRRIGGVTNVGLGVGELRRETGDEACMPGEERNSHSGAVERPRHGRPVALANSDDRANRFSHAGLLRVTGARTPCEMEIITPATLFSVR